MNDPNGLVYFKGVYHLYFQYNPEANVWGNMSWGHASSPDLVHWTEHPVAIPQGEGEAIYSGSAVVDHRNSSGFGVGDDPPLVAIYTSAYAGGRQAQSLAFSTDGGMTWTKHSGNPVLDRTSTAFRDPKVFWYSAGAEAGYWVMVAAEAEARQIVFYQSDDLRRWDYLSAFGPVDSAGGLWECPDLFALPVDGDPDRKSWVLIVSRDPGRDTSGSFTQYFVGDFDGIRFTPASDASRRLDGGRDLYAAVSFDNAPNGRRILIGWMSNWNYAPYVPTSPWRGSMSLPRELSLATIQGVVTLVQHLPAELRVLDQVADRRSIGPFDLEGTRSFDGSAQYRVDVTFEPLDAHEFGLDLMVGDGQATRLRYDVRTARLGLDRTHSGETGFEGSFASIESAPIPLLDGALHLRVLVDRGSVEVFAHGGAVSLTEQVFSTDSSTGFALGSFGGTTRVRALEWTPLRSEPIVDLG